MTKSEAIAWFANTLIVMLAVIWIGLIVWLVAVGVYTEDVFKGCTGAILLCITIGELISLRTND